MRILKTKKNFRNEFKRQLRYAIAAGVGFLIIFAWREAIINSTKELVEKITESGTANNLSTALVITIIGVLIIIVSSRLLRDKR